MFAQINMWPFENEIFFFFTFSFNKLKAFLQIVFLKILKSYKQNVYNNCCTMSKLQEKKLFKNYNFLKFVSVLKPLSHYNYVCLYDETALHKDQLTPVLQHKHSFASQYISAETKRYRHVHNNPLSGFK